MVLVPGVERNCKRAASFPFEDSLRGAFIPHAGRASSCSNGDDFFIQLSLRLHAFARIDFRNIRVGYHLIGKSTYRPFAVFTLPVAELFRTHVFYKRATDDRYTFRLDPFFVRTVLVQHELNIGMNFKLFDGSGHGILLVYDYPANFRAPHANFWRADRERFGGFTAETR